MFGQDVYSSAHPLAENRVLSFLIGVTANFVLPDHHAEAFRTLPLQRRSWLDNLVQSVLQAFTRWDAQHFLHIARFGYTYENNLAFFPLYPALVRFLAELLRIATPNAWMTLDSAILLSAFAVNQLLFVSSGLMLLKLTSYLFYFRAMAHMAVWLLAFNPASVFFAVCYSEPLYLFLTLSALTSLYVNDRVLRAAVWFSLASATRSNGVLNVGFILFHTFSAVLRDAEINDNRRISYRISAALFGSVLIVAPTLLFQLYVFRRFCVTNFDTKPNLALVNLAQRHNLTILGQLDRLEWCGAALPLPYSAVQRKYWDVKWLGYFQMRKLPLFFLAAPSLWLSFSAISYFKFDRSRCRTYFEWLSRERCLLPFLVHLFVLCLLGIFVINVEVTTRMLFSSSPILLWFVAHRFVHDGIILHRMPGLKMILEPRFLHRTRFIFACTFYFLSYAIVGTVLHVNFFPWT